MTEQNTELLKDAVPGVYMAKCVLNDGKTYKAAVSVGWNPCYDNKVKTVEAYVIADSELMDFYGETIYVELVKYIRPEALYDDFDALIIAISCDI